jgi:hypothetical protein
MFPGFVFLQTGYNAYEKGLIRALLEGENIKFYSEGRGPGEYLKLLAGQSVYAEDFFVAEEDFERARLIIEGFSFSDDDQEVIVVGSGDFVDDDNMT